VVEALRAWAWSSRVTWSKACCVGIDCTGRPPGVRPEAVVVAAIPVVGAEALPEEAGLPADPELLPLWFEDGRLSPWEVLCAVVDPAVDSPPAADDVALEVEDVVDVEVDVTDPDASKELPNETLTATPEEAMVVSPARFDA